MVAPLLPPLVLTRWVKHTSIGTGQDSRCQGCSLSQHPGKRQHVGSTSNWCGTSASPILLPAPVAHRIGTLGHCLWFSPHALEPPGRLRVKLTRAQRVSSLGHQWSACAHPMAGTPCREPLCAPGGTAVPGPHALKADSGAEELPWEGCSVPKEGNPCLSQGLLVTPGSRPPTPSRPQKSTGH